MRKYPLSGLLLVGTSWRNIGCEFTMRSQPQSGPLVSGPVLARWLGVTEKTVHQLAKAAIVVRAGRGLYKLEESVRGYCEHVRRTASQRGGEASLEAMRNHSPRASGRAGVEERGGTGRAVGRRRGRGRLVEHVAPGARRYVGGALARRCAAGSFGVRVLRQGPQFAGRARLHRLSIFRGGEIEVPPP